MTLVRAAALAAALLSLLLAGGAAAHPLHPGYLEISPAGDGAHRVVWRVPDVQGRAMPIEARLPERCTPRTGPAPRAAGEAWLSSWRADCPEGLSGGRIAIEGLARTRTDVLVRWQDAPGADWRTARLTAEAPAFTVPARSGPLETMRTFGLLGFAHILEGIDHLLFVFALMLVVSGPWRLAGAITAFTLAHSASLAGASFGWVSVPGPPVEAVIALSIVCLAAEVVALSEGRPGPTSRRPWLICFPFGLLHGLGFAGALAEIGLPEEAALVALLAFNLGVEAGQLAFVAAILALGWALRRLAVPRPAFATRAAAYAIGTVAGFWFVERVAAF